MKFISIFILLGSLCTCISKKSDNNFSKFSSRFNLISFPFTINDQQSLANWGKVNAIDTNLVMQYELIKQHVDSVNPLKNVSDYTCSYVGKYEAKNYNVLMYKIHTTDKGNGKPKIILATFTKEGKKADEIIVMWNNVSTNIFNQRIILNIPDNSNIEIKSIITNSGYLNGLKVDKKKTVKIMRYQMNKDGKIIKLKEFENDVFKDDNPKILDEMPL